MDYDALAQILPLAPHLWTTQHVQLWLQFVHLPTLSFAFSSRRINGTVLSSLNEQQLEGLGVTNNIIKRKIIRWVKQGFPEFEQHLISKGFDNKENIPPLQRKQTVEKGVCKVKPNQNWRPNRGEEGMVIRSCDGSLAAYHMMKQRVLKIGRSPANIIRSLQVSVETEHAQIVRMKGQHYLLDKGTQSGTFIKIIHPRLLKKGSLVEMGSFIMEVKEASKTTNTILLQITHMISLGTCDVTISLMDGCSFYSFGRRKSNNFYADDEHLSGLHAKIFLKDGEFFIEDMHSTNGTWLRLNHPRMPSAPFLLEQGSIFKVGTTVTYQCMAPEVKQQKMDIEYVDSCLACNNEKRNVLFLPCKHNAVCSGCASDLSLCPLCESAIGQRIKMYI